MKRIIAMILTSLFTLSMAGGCTGGGDSSDRGTVTRVNDERNLSPEEYTLVNTVGTDALGRIISERSEKNFNERYVGIWYSLWLGQHKNSQSDIYDITKILASPQGEMKLRDMYNDYDDTRLNEFHFFAEPLYGYYSMSDPWVLTRHMELLTLAGIDYLCCDMTNIFSYEDVVHKLINILLDFQSQGFNPPKLMFYTNSHSSSIVRRIYDTYYKDHPEYDAVWFKPNGKPAIAGVSENNNGASDCFGAGEFVTADLIEKFDFYESQWPTSKMTGDAENPNSIPWMSWYYPQHIHENTKAISVSVAQHSETRISYSAKAPVSSRAYNHTLDMLDDDFTAGANFESEWKTVFDYLKQGETIKNVLVTGWNEWMAIKTPFNGDISFCDGWNDEYSRDIEMMNGSCGDNFYMQLMRNLREFKYEKPVHYKYQNLTPDISSESELFIWDGVKAHYRDFKGDAMKRNYENAVGSATYTDNSNRNDITDVKVVHNNSHLFVYVKTAENITAHESGDTGWMNLFINANSNGKGFNGYNFVINRKPTNDGKTSVEKSEQGYNEYKQTGTAEYAVYGNVILYKIPLSTLGLKKDDCYIKFKVTDNVQNPENIMSYYVSGDSAPVGRLSYSYGY